MFQDTRNAYGLTRQQLADATHRSVNYILKAEQATFPAPPIALLEYFAQAEPPPGVQLKTPWEPLNKDVMRDAYRDFQRRKRYLWLEDWQPVDYSAGLPFRKKWVKRTALVAAWSGSSGVGFLNEWVNVYPSQYALSAGLCLPAAVLYRNEKSLDRSGAVVTCMEDLVDYVLSGQYRAANLSDERLPMEENSILRIAKEEGVRIPNGQFAA